MIDLSQNQISKVNGGVAPVVVAWAVLEGAAGLAGIFGGAYAIGHYFYSRP